MDADLPAAGANKKLNNAVAITVVLLATFLGLCKIKDDNLVQAMQQSKADAVDSWNEYQATKLKRHVTQGAADQLAVLGVLAHDQAPVARQQAALQTEIAKYTREVPLLETKAKGFEAQYDALNIHDDQFDAADAFISIAVSAAAVSALAESIALLLFSWGMGAFGVVMGLAGFLGWALHPAMLARLLS